MADFFTVKVDTSLLNRFTRQFPGQAMQVVGELMRREAIFFLEDLREERLSGVPLKVRSGDLRRDGYAVLGPITEAAVEVQLVWTSRYAATQEFGDPNRVPRRARMLAIPLPEAKTPTGVSRYPSPLRKSLATAFPEGTFVRKSQNGMFLILWGVRNGEPVPLFILKRRVNIPARMGARALLREKLAGIAARIEADLVARMQKT